MTNLIINLFFFFRCLLPFTVKTMDALGLLLRLNVRQCLFLRVSQVNRVLEEVSKATISKVFHNLPALLLL